MPRTERWGTRLGFILAAMGSAVGLGNVWRFPTTVAINGGGAFVIMYLGIILLIGVPLMIAEIALGRASQRNVVATFTTLGPRSRWWLAGAISMAASFIILSYYSVIAGWTLLYLLAGTLGAVTGKDPEALALVFSQLTANPFLSLFATALFLILTVAVVIRGIVGGIERANRWLMPGVVVLLTVLAVRTMFLPGALAGARWLLTPRPELITLRTGIEALGQVFFSFGIGMGAILTYGSYLPRTGNIPGSAVMISIADLGVAMLSALIIIPALFAFGVEPGVGAGLLFITLPSVFNFLPLAPVWNSLFFLMLAAAALSSSVAMLEVIVAYLVDGRKMERRRAAIGSGAAVLVAGIPSALAAGLLAPVRVRGFDLLEVADYVASNLLLPLAGLLTILFVGWVWGTRRARAEVELGAPYALLLNSWTGLIRYVVPPVIAVIFLTGLMRS